MPLQKRLPKYGFKSRVGMKTAEVRLGDLARLTGDVVDMDALKAADLVRNDMTRARIFLAGSVDRALTVKGLGVSKGARAAIEQAGGKVED
jgi:large subunit ribosomal protein L15